MTARTRAVFWTLVAVSTATLVVWTVGAQSTIGRPNSDGLDLFDGPPDPSASVIEEQLVWALTVVDGRALTESEVRARLDDDFLEQLDPAAFIEVTEQIATGAPYAFHGFRRSSGGDGAVALIVDRDGQTFAMSIAHGPDDPERLSGLLVLIVDIGTGPFTPSEFALHLVAGVLLVVAAALVAGAGRRPLQGGLLAVAGVLWLTQLLELSGNVVAYTVGLVAGPVAAAILVGAVVAGAKSSRRRVADRVVVGGAAAAALTAVAVLLFVDTGVVALPDQLLSIAPARSIARPLVRISSLLTLLTAALAAARALSWQAAAGGSRNPSRFPATAAVCVGALIAAAPAVSGVLDRGGFDLSMSSMFAVAAMIIGFGIAGTALTAESEERLIIQASQRRVVEAGEDARRRLERDLHDGAQQRLLGVMLALRVGRTRFTEGDDELDAFLGSVTDDLSEAVTELRELSRGLHPAILEQGVVVAAESLAESSPIPVSVSGDRRLRVPSSIEQAAYFVVAEALANATRHAAASRVEIEVVGSPDELCVTIIDDGCGGAALDAGSGLQNLADRVMLIGGTWALNSEPGRGTTVKATLPCG